MRVRGLDLPWIIEGHLIAPGLVVASVEPNVLTPDKVRANEEFIMAMPAERMPGTIKKSDLNAGKGATSEGHRSFLARRINGPAKSRGLRGRSKRCIIAVTSGCASELLDAASAPMKWLNANLRPAGLGPLCPDDHHEDQ